MFLCHAGLRAASSHGDGAYRGPGMLHHLLAGPSGPTTTAVACAGSTPSTLNSEKSNTYDNNVVQRIIGAKAGRPASTAVDRKSVV